MYIMHNAAYHFQRHLRNYLLFQVPKETPCYRIMYISKNSLLIYVVFGYQQTLFPESARLCLWGGLEYVWVFCKDWFFFQDYRPKTNICLLFSRMVAGHKILPLQSTVWMFYGNPCLVIIYNSEGGEGNKQAIELCLFPLPT